MISNAKNKLITLLVASVLLIGAFALLTHHPTPLINEDGHSDCDTTCQIACFSQAIVNLVAIPNHLDPNLLILPLVSIAFTFLVAVGFSLYYKAAFRYSLGPPLFKVFESYRY